MLAVSFCRDGALGGRPRVVGGDQASRGGLARSDGSHKAGMKQGALRGGP